jgi:heterodisulfide reductase subunit A
MNRTKPKIGVYVCHCGTNIAATVDVESLAAFAQNLENVVIARNYSYMCSDPGQELIQEDIQELDLNRIVVASCSPLMHEQTFRNAVKEVGLNPFFFQMANIREQCSWVIDDQEEATAKAKGMVAGAVQRVRNHRPLVYRTVEMNPSALVVGAGIAGMETALKLADSGKKVYLVEKEPSIGGHMAQLYKTFPTLDCAA